MTEASRLMIIPGMSRETATTTSKSPADLAEEIDREHPFEIPAEEAYLNLVRTRSVLSGELASIFRNAGLGEAQYNALRIAVASGSKGVRIDTIRRRLVDRDPDVSRLVDRLTRADLVERRSDPDDRRAVRILATEAGRRLARDLAQELDERHRRQLAHLTELELQALNHLLFKARHRPLD